MIDEARTPLIISAPSSESASLYRTFAKAIRHLDPADYELDEKQRSVTLNDQGVEKMQAYLKIDNLYDTTQIQSLYHLEQALRAETLFRRDKEYVVHNGEVIIVDEFTGRLMIGRRYSEGLHQAIEAKEGVEVQQESMTLATITFQNFFRLYGKLAGMTGTAATEAEEFHTIYKLNVVCVPPNKPSQRVDLPDRIYKTEAGKFKAIVEEVKERQKKGQPILLGTVSVEKNEVLSKLLTKSNVKHSVLNAKNNEHEAGTIAQAGQKGAVTLATNIAGRGTDIVLGPGVVELGGLHVIGSERHESRRIDNQLRGRGGRQGDPGSTQFYVSTEDDLMRIFGGDRMRAILERIGHSDETPIEHRLISRSLETAQKKVESHNFDTRKSVVQYDDVINRHRKVVYSRRRDALTGKDLKEMVRDMIETETKLISSALHTAKKQDIVEETVNLFGFEEKSQNALETAKTEEFEKELTQQALAHYKAREKSFGSDIVRDMERDIFLQVLDELWMQHLENMQHLREGIGWRQVGQRDPLVEYRREGQQLFDQMQAEQRTNLIRLLYRVIPRPLSQTVEVDTVLTKAAELSAEGAIAEKIIGRRKKTTQARKKSPKRLPTRTSTRHASVKRPKRKKNRTSHNKKSRR